MKTRERRPSIIVRGLDVTRFTYGASPRVILDRGERPERQDLATIRAAVATAGSLFEVALAPVRSLDELAVGSQLLRIECKLDCFKKTIIEITEVRRSAGRVTLCFTIVWPEAERGFNGFFPARDALDIQRSCGGIGETLYLHRRGPLPPPEHTARCFFTKMHNFANEFATLVQCWAMVMCPDLIEARYVSFDPYLHYWLREFEVRHGRGFQQRLVWDRLYAVAQDATLRGINDIYDDRSRSWSPTDRISPLLDRMQLDILEVLVHRPELADYIFSEDRGDYWTRCLEVLFDRYYGVKAVVVSSRQGETPFRAATSDLRTSHRLAILARLIERPGTSAEGLAARAAYERIAGCSYTK